MALCAGGCLLVSWRLPGCWLLRLLLCPLQRHTRAALRQQDVLTPLHHRIALDDELIILIGASIMAPAIPFCFWTTQKHLTVERTMGLRT